MPTPIPIRFELLPEDVENLMSMLLSDEIETSFKMTLLNRLQGVFVTQATSIENSPSFKRLILKLLEEIEDFVR